MVEKVDYKKKDRELYVPKRVPGVVEVPGFGFIMVNGRGAPSGGDYQESIEILYGLAYTIKMSKMKGLEPEGYFEYAVPPLEGLWWSAEGKISFQNHDKGAMIWTSMIRQPEFVTEEVFQWAVEECRRKKPGLQVDKARFERFDEGLCVQMMHVGPYDDEPATLEVMHDFIRKHGLTELTGHVHKHHEIYLSDPRKTAPEKLKTVLRLPVKR